MPSLTSLSSAIVSRTPTKTSKAYLIELDKNTDTPVKGLNSPASYVAFQYFPETLTDSKQVNFQQKEIPGGSLPLYQWISSGERLISFSVIFSCDVDYASTSIVSNETPQNPLTLSANAQALQQRLKNVGQAARNPDLRGAVAWLRRYLVPTYSNDYTHAPNKLRLFMPNSGIGFAGGTDASNSRDAIHCVMTQCEVTYEAFFQSGVPRLLTVSLSFAQIPQFNGGVFFPHANAGSAIQTVAQRYTDLFPKE